MEGPESQKGEINPCQKTKRGACFSNTEQANKQTQVSAELGNLPSFWAFSNLTSGLSVVILEPNQARDRPGRLK